ncbi:hypothetical protein RSOL_172160, partial [Rhizoctonia solani AG-3 Rhs1AP]
MEASNQLLDFEQKIVDQVPVALYDLPPNDTRSREYVSNSGRRQSRSTERNVQYRAVCASQESTRRKSNDTRARNRSLSCHSNETSERARPNLSDTAAISTLGQRGRSRAINPLVPSATPEATTNKHPSPTQASDKSQYTYVYETLTDEALVRYAKEELNLNVEGCDTRAIIDLLKLAEAEQASQVEFTRRPPSIVMLPPTPLVVGGKRRRSQVSTPPNDDASGKLRRKVTVEEVEDVDALKPHGKPVTGDAILVEEDTATESETDSEPLQPTNSSARLAAECITGKHSGGPPHPHQPPQPPHRGTQAPCPTRDNTPSTVLDSQLLNVPSPSPADPLPNSHSLYGVSIPPNIYENLPEKFFQPLSGPAHARLRAEILLRYLTDAFRKSDATVATQAGTPDPNTPTEQPTDVDEVPETEFNPASNTSQRAICGSSFTAYTSSGSAPQLSQSHFLPRPKPTVLSNTANTADVDEVPETEFEPASDTSQGATRGSLSATRTYRGPRSHNAQSSGPEAPVVDKLPQPNSPRLTAAQLLRLERSRPASGKRRSRVAASAKEPPTSRPQARLPLGGRGNVVGRARGGPRRLDPASAARNDMLAFNRTAAQDRATSVGEDIFRQSCSPSPTRTADDLLEDKEEPIAKARVYTKRTWPLRRSRVRKPKPLARDVSGLDRQVLIMAKIHLFAYALVHGIYQTRSTFLGWASNVHEATAQVELPSRPYNQPGQEIYEIIVNSIATKRGKAKEQLREFVARVSGFRQNMKKHEIIQRNAELFDQLYPNNFHCRSCNPRQGDYEHPEIGHCIALIIFNGPNSVGVLYPEYFREMPLTAVAFCLAIWQFCLEEWVTGWRENGDLSAGDMREKYEAQLAGLQQLRRVAPRRMHRLQNEWRDEYSGALLGPTNEGNADPTHLSQMRPDTPELGEAISVEEMDERLLETARQESIRERMAQLAGEDLANSMDVDEDLRSGTSAPPSRAQTPPTPEYNDYGVLTARSKGKGRGN